MATKQSNGAPKWIDLSDNVKATNEGGTLVLRLTGFSDEPTSYPESNNGNSYLVATTGFVSKDKMAELGLPSHMWLSVGMGISKKALAKVSK